MFPKGHLFEKDELILLWMAEDLLRPPKKGETLEEVGSECFDELASRMFFTQYFQDGENYFVMHDLLLDLAVFLAGDFYFRLEELGEEEEEISIRTRHLCGISHHCSSKLFNSISKVESLRTLLYNKFSSPPFNIEAATCEVLSKCKFLRVLSLHKLDVLPDSIRELIHLRYLDLSFSNIKTLPESFCNLHNLQTLKLYYCSKLIMLPSGMHNLVELRHLDLRGTSLKEMPREISKLKHLQILRNFVVGKNKDSNGLEELGGLSNLHGLFWIEKLENIVDVEESRSARIIDKTHIEELCLEWSSGDDDMVSNTQTERDILDSLQPHNGLKELRIKGYKGTIFPNWVGSCSFYNMTSVYLASCNNCCMLPSLGELPSLQSLHIEGFGQLKTIGMEFYKNEDSHQSSSLEPFPSLQNLEFHDMPCWEEWELAGNRLPTYLEVLSIRHCRKLEFLKRQMIKYGLVELRIHDSCDSLTSFSVDDFPCLKVLDISMCSNLESVSISDPPHVALRRLSIHSCPEFVSFPGDILAAPNLIHFSVIMCSKFEALPCFMESLLPNLEYLFVQGCPGICRLPEGGLPPILKELRVGGCEEQLKALSSMGNMDTLTSLTILGSSEVRSYRELHSLPRLPSLTTLHLWGFHDLEELDCDKLLRLSSLQCLQISYCEKLENISGEKLPSSLLLLQIQDCPLLEQHCNNKNQEIWSKISHIPTIQVNYKQIF